MHVGSASQLIILDKSMPTATACSQVHINFKTQNNSYKMLVTNFNRIAVFIYVRRDYAELKLNASNMKT